MIRRTRPLLTSARAVLVVAVAAGAGLLAPWSTTSALAAQGDVVLVDVPGVPGTVGTVFGYDLSDDGRYAVVERVSLGASNTADIYVVDIDTGVATNVHVGVGGEPANGRALQPSISDDGRYVAYTSTASNLVEGDTNGASDAYVVDRTTGETVLVASGATVSRPTYEVRISGDGASVVFSTAVPLVAGDTNSQSDVFVMNLETGDVVRASNAADGTAGTGFNPSIDDDGGLVTFVSANSLAPADTNGNYDIYVANPSTGAVSVASVNSAGTIGDAGNSYGGVVSGNGRYVTFGSTASNMAEPDDDAESDVFVRDLATGETTLASIDRFGGPADGFSGGSTISDNGRLIAFHSTATNMVTDEGVGGQRSDVYVRDMRTEAIHLALRTPSGEPPNAQSEGARISGDGRFVLSGSFATDIVPGTTSWYGPFRYEVGDVDATAPSVTIEASPADPTGDTTPTFAFSSDEGGAEFECSLSTGADDYSGCESPVTYPTRLGGEYTFKVRATDQAGNTGQPAAVSFTLDDEGPVVSLEGGPPAVTGDSTPTLPFSAEPGTSFECSLSSGAPDYTPCTSPVTFPAQPDGPVTFYVRGTDPLGNVGIVTSYTFNIDASAPTVSLDEAPSAQGDDRTPTFAFSSADGTSFQCTLGVPTDWQACTSPVSYGPLGDGSYTFAVRTLDEAGNASVPVSHTFAIATVVVELPAPSTPDLSATSDTGLSTTDNYTSDSTPTFTGTGAAGTSVVIYVDGAPRGTAMVTSTGSYAVTTPALALGTHEVTAVAIDGGGHTSPASSPLSVTIVPATACHTATNRINGTAAANTLTGARLGDLIFGLGGNDTIDGKTNSDCLMGGTGNDTVRGGVGNDELIGEDGTDTLALGDGVDIAVGGAGNDKITARDGVADQVDCGAGTADIATVDPLDVVINCETVRRA